ASLPLQSSLVSKTYLKSDHLNGGGSKPLSTYLERWKAPTSAVTRHGDTIYVSGFPPFDPATREFAVVNAMAPASAPCTVVLQVMCTKFSRARTPTTCQWSNRSNSSWS